MDGSEMNVSAALFITATVLLSVAAITSNVLLLSVIFAAQKLSSNVANLMFICIPHLELAVLVLIHRSITYSNTHNDDTSNFNSTNTAITQEICYEANAVIVQCLERSAILWSIFGVMSLTIMQYLHIERPFWYELHVTTRILVITSVVAGTVNHIIGLLPLFQVQFRIKWCENGPLGEVAYAIFAALVFIELIVIIALSIRMLVLAEQHRTRMSAYNVATSSRADSMRFLLILISTYVVSHIVPVIVGLVSMFDTDVEAMATKMDILHLIAPIVYALLYGSRTPQGFVRSIRMAICCCLPVKPVEKEVEIDDIFRLTMMRLGNVMVKIDEQAAQKRHSSFLKKKSQIMKSLPFLKPSENEHKPVRPYNSMDPALYREPMEVDKKDNAGRTMSLNMGNLEKSNRHAKAGRLFSWIPKKSARKLEITPRKEVDRSSETDDVVDTPVTLKAINPPRKLSNISEQSDIFEVFDGENNLEKETIEANLQTIDETLSAADVDLDIHVDEHPHENNLVIVEAETIDIEKTEETTPAVTINLNNMDTEIENLSMHSNSPFITNKSVDKQDSV